VVLDLNGPAGEVAESNANVTLGDKGETFASNTTGCMLAVTKRDNPGQDHLSDELSRGLRPSANTIRFSPPQPVESLGQQHGRGHWQNQNAGPAIAGSLAQGGLGWPDQSHHGSAGATAVMHLHQQIPARCKIVQPGRGTSLGH
jgi:hypothetical protein